MIKYEDQKFQNIIQAYPLPVKEILNTILSKGFTLTLVGGAVRDVLLNAEKTTDLDFEIRKEVLSKPWEEELSELFQGLSFNNDVEKLSFSVFRIQIDNYELEFASPREEIYPDSDGSFGHSDFQVKLSHNLNYNFAFARRDLTINSIGLEINDSLSTPKLKLIDPFGGVDHLIEKQLIPCGDNFFKDPVRLLRTIRFSQKLEFEFSKKLEVEFKKFDLTKLTSFYLLKEGSVISLNSFLLTLANIVSDNKIPCSFELKLLLKNASHFKATSEKKEDLLWDVVYNSELSTEEILKISNLLLIKQKIVKEFIHIKQFVFFINSFSFSELNNISDGIDQLTERESEIFNHFIQGRKFFSNKTDFITQLSELSSEKFDYLETLFTAINQLDKDQNFVEKRKNIDNNLRSVFSYFYYFTKE